VPAEQSRSCVRKSLKSCTVKPSEAFAFHGTAVTVNSQELVYISHRKAAQQSRLRLLSFMEKLSMLNSLELVYVSHGKAAQPSRLRLLPFLEKL
jgi:hypothetical protein